MKSEHLETLYISLASGILFGLAKNKMEPRLKSPDVMRTLTPVLESLHSQGLITLNPVALTEKGETYASILVEITDNAVARALDVPQKPLSDDLLKLLRESQAGAAAIISEELQPPAIKLDPNQIVFRVPGNLSRDDAGIMLTHPEDGVGYQPPFQSWEV